MMTSDPDKAPHETELPSAGPSISHSKAAGETPPGALFGSVNIASESSVDEVSSQEPIAVAASPATEKPDPEIPVDGGTAAVLKTPRRVTSEALLSGERELLIVHGADVYRLCVTRQGKLILQK